MRLAGRRSSEVPEAVVRALLWRERLGERLLAGWRGVGPRGHRGGADPRGTSLGADLWGPTCFARGAPGGVQPAAVDGESPLPWSRSLFGRPCQSKRVSMRWRKMRERHAVGDFLLRPGLLERAQRMEMVTLMSSTSPSRLCLFRRTGGLLCECVGGAWPALRPKSGRFSEGCGTN